MTLLLDTHALLWWLGGQRMTEEARERIADPSVLVAVSAASIWEASIKQALGKLTVRGSVAGSAVGSGFEPLRPQLGVRLPGTNSISVWTENRGIVRKGRVA